MKLRISSFCLAFLLLTSNMLSAGISEIKKVEDVIEVLRQIHAIPERDIPPALLRNSHGVAVIPGMLKAGFILGGQYGTGILCIRNRNGS